MLNQQDSIYYRCEICEEHFQEKYFDTSQERCYLHCEKNESTGWHEYNENNQLIWNQQKINSFWKYIQETLDHKYDLYLHNGDDAISWEYEFNNVIFPKFQYEDEYYSIRDNLEDIANNFYVLGNYPATYNLSHHQLNTIINDLEIVFFECQFLELAHFEKYNFKKSVTFKNCIFEKNILWVKNNTSTSLEFKKCNFKNNDLNFKNRVFEKKFSIKECFNIKKIDFYNSVFNDKFRFQKCKISEKALFNNTRFKDLADFYHSTFNKVSFTRTTFEDIAVFTKMAFKENADFQYTTFEKLSLFRSTTFQKELNLQDSIFKENANFLDIRVNTLNRETARIIKDSFEQQNNIIEANKFYALEMKEREKELDKDKKNNFFEWLVFKIHGLSSNHSQNWVLALFWIVNISFVYSFLSYYQCYFEDSRALVYSLAFCITMIFFIETSLIASLRENQSKIAIFFITVLNFLVYRFSTNDPYLKYFSTNLNPFSIMHDNDPLTFFTFIYKITITYLIYQFVVSIRQNTRRQ